MAACFYVAKKVPLFWIYFRLRPFFGVGSLLPLLELIPSILFFELNSAKARPRLRLGLAVVFLVWMG